MSDGPMRILVVDDSRIFRSVVQSAFSGMVDCQVVGSVFSGKKALEFLEQNKVDLITLDVEMPEMNGLEVLRAMQERFGERAPAVVMLSAHTRTGAKVTIEALSAGAVGFVTKPEAGDVRSAMATLSADLRAEVDAVRQSHRGRSVEMVAAQLPTRQAPSRRDNAGIILIGSSTGGPQALTSLLPPLCGMCGCPIIVVQHMPPLFTKSLADNLDRHCQHKVVEAGDRMAIEDEHVYIAPGGLHLELAGSGAALRCRLSDGAPENGCRPAVDVLFRSAAKALEGRPMVGVILTGMGNDGATGVTLLKSAGAQILVQDEGSCVVYGMPKKAKETGCADAEASLSAMPFAIIDALVAFAG
ncbi:MAG: chemotaxis-specific protein-glutamate methyltransferase CheB [Planctomycetota bacterium]|jgi:two-component system chemotaxis response regulator CheB|nr:chemotaxis-specific protein-glutamate methyltransferase CheB [Planctomycetota bacterium]